MKKPFIQNFNFRVASEARLIDAIRGFPVLTVTAIKQISDEIWRCYVTASERKLKKNYFVFHGKPPEGGLLPVFKNTSGANAMIVNSKFETIV